MIPERPPQKLISFTNSKSDLDKIEADLREGWRIVSLMANDGCYIGVMEKLPNTPARYEENIEVYIPPRRKMKISY